MRRLSLAIGVALLLPSVAWAKPRVALAPIEGDSAGAIEDMVAELLDGDYSVAGPSQVRRKIDKLELGEKLGEKDLKKLAKELEADAIVRGDLTTKGKHKVLHVRLFVHGKRVKGFKIEFGSARSQKLKDALKDKLVEKIGDGTGGGGQEEQKPPKKKQGAESEDTSDTAETGEKADKGERAEQADKADKADKADEASSDEKPAKTDKRKKTASEGEGEGEESEGDEPASGKKKKTASADEDEGEGVEAKVTPVSPTGQLHSANRSAVRVDFGPSASGRQLTFTSRSFDQAPKPYKNAIVPGGRVAGELYPLAFGNPNGLMAGLGVGGNYDKTIGLKLRSTAQLGTQFPVDQTHWSVGLRFRVAFGTKPTSPTITLHGGMFHRKFVVDRSALDMGNVIDLPDVLYKGYDPGVDLRFPLGRMIALVAGGEAGLVSDTGDIQKVNQYGQARVTGGGGYAGVDITVAKRFALRAVAEVAQFGFAFTGNGEMANNRDGDPTTKDIGGASDRVMGGSLTFGVLY
jgi:hypothetical protein